MTENEYQARLIKKLKRMFPGAIVLKNDSDYIQGIPDLLILFGNSWAALEVKASYSAPTQVNQTYWVELMDDMSFAAFIFPENEEDILDDLQITFRVSR